MANLGQGALGLRAVARHPFAMLQLQGGRDQRLAAEKSARPRQTRVLGASSRLECAVALREGRCRAERCS